LCMLELLVAHKITNWEELRHRVSIKQDKLKTWSELI